MIFVLCCLLVKRERVDLGLDALVMGAECLENAPYVRKNLGIVQRFFRCHSRRHEDREDYVAVVLAFRTSHDAPDGLHHVHGGVLGVEEYDRVQVRNVYALCQAAGIRQNTALVMMSQSSMSSRFINAAKKESHTPFGSGFSGS